MQSTSVYWQRLDISSALDKIDTTFVNQCNLYVAFLGSQDSVLRYRTVPVLCADRTAVNWIPHCWVFL